MLLRKMSLNHPFFLLMEKVFLAFPICFLNLSVRMCFYSFPSVHPFSPRVVPYKLPRITLLHVGVI